jgi:hypothetical protein
MKSLEIPPLEPPKQRPSCLKSSFLILYAHMDLFGTITNYSGANGEAVASEWALNE